jgi:hypothetical protein
VIGEAMNSTTQAIAMSRLKSKMSRWRYVATRSQEPPRLTPQLGRSHAPRSRPLGSVIDRATVSDLST